MYYVYVLQSKLNGQLYVGSTNNLKSRFELHNSGGVISTKRYKPWKLLYYEAYESDKLARMREKRLKYNGNAVRELKKRIGFSKVNFPVKFLKSGAGFTLIEVLIVIALVGVMAMGVITLLDPLAQFQKANDARRKSDLSQIQKALETFYQDNGRYPAYSTTNPVYRIVRLDLTTADWGQEFLPYMSTLPKDPASAKNYVYYSSPDPPYNGQSYYIYASLDRANDPQACKSGACTGAGIPIDSCGPPPPGDSAICDYGVSSPNVSP